jgi:hypothetical protein
LRGGGIDWGLFRDAAGQFEYLGFDNCEKFVWYRGDKGDFKVPVQAWVRPLLKQRMATNHGRARADIKAPADLHLVHYSEGAKEGAAELARTEACGRAHPARDTTPPPSIAQRRPCTEIAAGSSNPPSAERPTGMRRGNAAMPQVVDTRRRQDHTQVDVAQAGQEQSLFDVRSVFRVARRIEYLDDDCQKCNITAEEVDQLCGRNWRFTQSAKGAPAVATLGEELVGASVAIWWPKSQSFECGAITAYDGMSHKVCYMDDSTIMQHDLSSLHWRLDFPSAREVDEAVDGQEQVIAW